MNEIKPGFYQFHSDDSPVYVSYIGDDGIAKVGNECGEEWHEPIANLYPAPEGWTW